MAEGESVVAVSGTDKDFAAAVVVAVLKPQAINGKLLGAQVMGIECKGMGAIEQQFDASQITQEEALVKAFTSSCSGTTVKIVRRLLYKGNKHLDGGGQEDQVDEIEWSSTPSQTRVVKFPGFSVAHDPEAGTLSLTLTEAAGLIDGRRHLEKISRWCNDRCSKAKPGYSGIPSLGQVDLRAYDSLYRELKDKYSQQLIQDWACESTDPEKFIHEDLAIAAYLILLFRRHQAEDPSSWSGFVDVGCGNGLLVYILTMEGFTGGLGVDLRPRKIWDVFRSRGANLRVETIEPAFDDSGLGQCFSGRGWLIGNHSDELTPWLPVMAARSGARIFLLPCCPFDFFGKYSRRSPSSAALSSGAEATGGQQLVTTSSVYQEYLSYVKSILQCCGFGDVQVDKLRIPSTKRICFVSERPSSKTQALSSPGGIETLMEELRAGSRGQSGLFVARPAVETVRNCTRVPKEVRDQIIDIMVKEVFSRPDWTKGSFKDKFGERGQGWNPGGSVPLSDLGASLPSDLLSRLKAECGGLQTLARNHGHIFVVDRGSVRLRCPPLDGDFAPRRKKNRKGYKVTRKSKPCWLFDNHPQGCPTDREQCMWAHGPIDIVNTFSVQCD